MNFIKSFQVFFWLFSSIIALGQTKESLDLDWRDELLIVDGDTTLVQGCDYCSFVKGVPEFVYTITEEIDSVWLEEVESHAVIGYEVSNDLSFKTEAVLSGSHEIHNIRFNAIYKVGSEVRKVSSVTIAYSSKVNKRVRTIRRKKSTVVDNSLLASGDWFKLKIKEDGVYRLDAKFFTDLGISLSSIDASKIKVYGSGGAMLPQQNDLPRPQDLQENAIFSTSTSAFTVTDYVLFYGQQTDKLVVDASSRSFDHTKHLYSDFTYYYLTIEGLPGKRVGLRSDTGTPTKTLSAFDDYYFNEVDNENTLHSGRSWYEKSFDSEFSQSFAFDLPGIVADTDFELKSAVMAQAFGENVSFQASLNGTPVGVHNINKNATSSSYYGMTGYEDIEYFDLSSTDFGNTNTYNYQLVFSGDSYSDKVGLPWQTHGFFDYLTVYYQRNLNDVGGQYRFRSFESLDQQVTTFQFDEAPTIVFEINDGLAPTLVELTSSSFIENDNILNEYVAVFDDNYKEPIEVETIKNQNLHASTTPELLVVTSELLKASATAYSEYKIGMGYDVQLVTCEEIYNEFSSGNVDISAIRDYSKLLYDQAPSVLKNITLFGSTSYDYKGVLPENNNHVPIYQSIESLHNVKSYASDDFYGFLTDGDGLWKESSVGNHDMVVGVGRIPARNNIEANDFLEKLKLYENSPESFGDWRTNVGFLADDGDNNLHVRDATRLGDYIDANQGQLRTRKLFLDRYVQLDEGGLKYSAEFDEEYLRLIDQGAFIVNFTGHGRPDQLAEERMIVQDRLPSMTNSDRLPIYVTATCEFGVFDDPEVYSGGVELVLMPSGGAIAAVTTTRVVYASSNFIINSALYRELFNRADNGDYLTLGEAFKHIKNESQVGVNNRNFSLVGDPAMRMAMPSNKVILETFNDSPIDQVNDTLSALSDITFKGIVASGDSTLLTSFDGLVKVTVYDKTFDQSTLGSVDSPYKFKERTSKLFEGLASVEGGIFEVSFTVPKDISYSYELGRVFLYAVNEDSTLDASGHYSNIVVGGTDSFSEDDSSPTAELFMEDFSFVDGGYTSPNPVFLARLYDENGINISTSSVGHELSIVLDGNVANRKVINEFYTADKDDNTAGTVSYPLFDLSDGKHTIELTAWDAHNNPVQVSIDFEVGDVLGFYAYPNPSVESTNLQIDHGHKGEAANIYISIYDSQGSLVLEHEHYFAEVSSVINTINWDRTLRNERAAAGIYFIHVDASFSGSDKTLSETTKVILTD